jgi:TRAP-type transport system periplasmic protein
VVLRMAALAPEGTSWAREIKAFTRDVDQSTHGQVTLKWYLGGIAGDESTVVQRIRKGQLDGTAGVLFCEKLAPSLKVMRVIGLYQTREESVYVLGRLRQQLDQEFAKSGFVSLGNSVFGMLVPFSRAPIRSFAELKNTRFWAWEDDPVWIALLREMGVKVVPGNLETASPWYDEMRTDGFMVTPTVALGYQWSARVRYYTDLNTGTLPGCVVIAQRALDTLSVEQQQSLRSASAKFGARFDEVSRSQDEALLGGLFEKQGLQRVHADNQFRSEFFEAARRARDKSGGTLLPAELLGQVLAWLADYRFARPPKR